MSWSIVWADQARRDLRALDRQSAQHVVSAVERLAETEYGDVVRLQGVRPPTWRLRVGDYRILFSYDYPARELRIRAVAPRGRAYRS